MARAREPRSLAGGAAGRDNWPAVRGQAGFFTEDGGAAPLGFPDAAGSRLPEATSRGAGLSG